MLVVPFKLAGIRIDGEGRVRIHRIGLHAWLLGQGAAHFRDPRIGLAGAVEHQVLVGIVGAGNPCRGAESALQRQAVPGVVVRVAWMRDGVDAPQLGAGLDVVAGDEAAAGLGVAAAGHALDDLAVDDERAARIAPALGPIGGGVVPRDLAGLGVEGNDMGIRGRDDELVVVDRHVALGHDVGVIGEQLLG